MVHRKPSQFYYFAWSSTVPWLVCMNMKKKKMKKQKEEEEEEED
jgi:membrane protein CcdC involved in cytochrome C biogenesis